MKKQLYLLVPALIISVTSFAQKGSLLVGGSLAFDYAKYPATQGISTLNQWDFSVTPMIGYQFAKAWTAGAILGYQHDQVKESAGPNYSGNGWSAGPFVRYTCPITSWVSVYGQFQGVYYDNDVTDLSSNIVFYGSRVEGLIYPALFFNVKNGFGINVSLGGLAYDYNYVKGGSNVSSTVNLTFGNTVLIGVSKNFGGHRKGA